MALIARFIPRVLSLENTSNGNRGHKTVKMANSASLYIGSFFDPRTGADGAQSFTANQKVRGVVKDIQTFQNGSYISVFEAPTVSGTLVQPTATVPGKYTTTSSNVSLATPDIIVYEEIMLADEIEAYITTGTAGALATRGTTTGSDKLNYFIEPDPNYPYLLLETGANVSATGLCFQIVDIPTNTNQLIVKLINADGAVS
jgi:hypothetical protein